MSPEERADVRVARLRTCPARDFAWKELWQEAKRTLSLFPRDPEQVHRDLKPIVRAAKYVRATAYRAWRKRDPVLPEGRSWGHLRSKLVTVNRFWKLHGSLNASRSE